MNVCLHEKLCEKKIKKDDLSKKDCKDNLRTLFVEIPSYKGAMDRARFRICPAKSDFNPSQPTAQTSTPFLPYLLP